MPADASDPVFDLTCTILNLRDPQVPAGRIALVGDSMSAALDLADLDGFTVYAMGGATFPNLGIWLALPSIARARALIVQAGVNDLLFGGSPAEVADDARAVLHAAPPEIPVWLIGAFPTGQELLAPGIRVDLNERLEQMCRPLERCTFVRTDRFADARGCLREEYDFGDGAHFSPAGAAVWKTLLGEIRSEATA